MMYLIRHGQTRSNVAGLLRGHADLPLDPTGQGQAEALAALFSPVPLTAVITSPLQRARATGAPLARVTGARLTVEPQLIDRDYGPWTGHSPDELNERFGSLDAAPVVEDREALVARVMAAVANLVAGLAPGPFAVVAHDAINRLILAGMLSGPTGISLRQPVGCWNLLIGSGERWQGAVVDAIPGDGHLPLPSGGTRP
ncbi:MAG: histidine phosphatase family protein [Candidatus Dormiibacterota bacterium]